MKVNLIDIIICPDMRIIFKKNLGWSDSAPAVTEISSRRKQSMLFINQLSVVDVSYSFERISEL